MSKLYELTKNLESESKKRLEDIHRDLDSLFQQHESYIESKLQQSNSKMLEGIDSRSQAVQQKIETLSLSYQESLQKRLEEIDQTTQQFTQRYSDQQQQTSSLERKALRLLFKPMFWIVLGGGWMLILGLLIWSVDFQQEKLNNLRASVKTETEVLEQLRNQTYGIQISNCQQTDGSQIPCVAIDSQSPTWGKNQEFRAILPKKD